MKTTSVAASFPLSFFPNAGISPLIPLRMANLIPWSVSVSVISCRVWSAFPVTSPTWQRAQLRANNFAPTATCEFWVAILSVADRMGDFKILEWTMCAAPRNPPIKLTEISKAAIRAFTSVFTARRRLTIQNQFPSPESRDTDSYSHGHNRDQINGETNSRGPMSHYGTPNDQGD